jgi:translation elongation factor EF-Tu-like GTPase
METVMLRNIPQPSRFAALEGDSRPPGRRWPPIEPSFLFQVDDVRDVGSSEIAAAGRVIRGRLYNGELVRILGSSREQPVIVSTIEVDGEPREQALALDAAALHVRGVATGELHPGMLLGALQHRVARPRRVQFGAGLYVVERDGGWIPIVAHS